MKCAPWLRLVAVSPCALATAIAGLAGCKGNNGPGDAKGSAPPPASAAPAPKIVRLVRRPAEVGERDVVERTSALTLGVEFWKDDEKLGTNDSARKEEYERTSEVLGLVGGAPARAKVHYARYRYHENSADKPTVDDSVLEGKTYVLDATDGKLRAENEKGKPASGPEMDKLRKLDADLGKDDPIVGAIGDVPLTVGQQLPMRQELLHSLASAESGELKGGRIWLDDVREEGGREVAILKWSADTRSQGNNGLEISWHMSGTVMLGVSPARTLATTLTGSLDVSGETMQRGSPVKMAGAGTITDKSTLTVTPP